MSSPTTPKRAGTSHDDAYESLRDAIRRHAIEPGARLNEVETATRLGVSRTPLRQALWRLLAEGFVNFQPRAGFSARALDPKSLRDLRETLMLVELTALDLSITRAGASDVDALLARWQTGRGAGEGNPTSLAETNEAFHLDLAALCSNEELSAVMERLQALLHGTRCRHAAGAASAAAHRIPLLTAVQGRQRPAARKALMALLEQEFPVAHANQDGLGQETLAPRRPADGEDNSVTSRIYAEIRRKLIGFELKPGERLRDQEIAEVAGASRPSVREALSRLVAEKLVVWEPNHGFSLRTLRTQEIFDLFELRAGLESMMVSLVIERGSNEQLTMFARAWTDFLAGAAQATKADLIREDEAFHARLAEIADNAVLQQELERIATRIHFIRGIDLRQQSGEWLTEHSQIADAIVNRNVKAASTLMHAHLARLFEEIHAALKLGIAELYLP